MNDDFEQQTRPGGQRRPGIFARLFWLFKLLQWLLVLGVFSALGFGLYENGATLLYLVKGEVVEGVVTSVPTDTAQVKSRSGSGHQYYTQTRYYPTIRYTYPKNKGRRYTINSVIPREDLKKGDTVTVRVLAEIPDAGRQAMPWWWHLITGGLLLVGVVFTPIVFFMGGAFNQMLGREKQTQLSPSPGRRRGGRAFKWIIILILPVLALSGIWAYYLPWVKIQELPHLFDPRNLLLEAHRRGGPPASGLMNDYELRLLSVPFIGWAVADDAYERALRARDVKNLARYHAAIADPNIDFRLDWKRLSWVIMAQHPRYLEKLLATGVKLEPEFQKLFWAEAKRVRKTRHMQVLKKFGLKP